LLGVGCVVSLRCFVFVSLLFASSPQTDRHSLQITHLMSLIKQTDTLFDSMLDGRVSRLEGYIFSILSHNDQ